MGPGIHTLKEEGGPLPSGSYKSQRKMGQDLKARARTVKLLEENTGESFMMLDLAVIFFGYDDKGTGNKK